MFKLILMRKREREKERSNDERTKSSSRIKWRKDTLICWKKIFLRVHTRSPLLTTTSHYHYSKYSFLLPQFQFPEHYSYDYGDANSD